MIVNAGDNSEEMIMIGIQVPMTAMQTIPAIPYSGISKAKAFIILLQLLQ
jgi:hypothetical protein